MIINKEENKKNILKLIIGVTIGIILLICIFGSFRTIKSGQVGIRVRFGKVVNAQMNEGVNFKMPIIEKIVKMNIQVQKTEVETSSASKDLQDVNMKLAVNYRVDGTKATELYKDVGTKYDEIGQVYKNGAVVEVIKFNSSKTWGLTNKGWVSMAYLKKV